MEMHHRSQLSTMDEADDDDDSSSAYGRAIKRIISKTRPALEFKLNSSNNLSSSAPYSSSNYMNDYTISGSINDQETISMDMNQYFSQQDFENRSIYSINESEIDPLSPNHILLQRLNRQFDTSFTNNSLSHDFSASHYNNSNNLNDDATSISSPYKRSPRCGTLSRRYSFNPKDLPSHNRKHQENSQQHLNDYQDKLGAPDHVSEHSVNDLDTKWSWRSLKREFKLSQAESLFHLYQAKLQQSFFVALLILNIIFNLGAIGSYMISKYHEMNIYLIMMRIAAIWVFASFLILIWFNKLWMQSKFSRTVASLAVLSAMIFGEASK